MGDLELRLSFPSTSKSTAATPGCSCSSAGPDSRQWRPCSSRGLSTIFLLHFQLSEAWILHLNRTCSKHGTCSALAVSLNLHRFDSITTIVSFISRDSPKRFSLIACCRFTKVRSVPVLLFVCCSANPHIPNLLSVNQ